MNCWCQLAWSWQRVSYSKLQRLESCKMQDYCYSDSVYRHGQWCCRVIAVIHLQFIQIADLFVFSFLDCHCQDRKCLLCVNKCDLWEYCSCKHLLLQSTLLLVVWHAPLEVRSAKRRHQSPEWMILSHSYRLIQWEIVWSSSIWSYFYILHMYDYLDLELE